MRWDPLGWHCPRCQSAHYGGYGWLLLCCVGTFFALILVTLLLR